MFSHFCSQQNDCLSPLIRGFYNICSHDKCWISKPTAYGLWQRQSNLDSPLSAEEKKDSFLLLKLFDSFVFNYLGGGKASYVAVVYKADLEGYKGVINVVEKLGDNYLLESLAVIFISSSQVYFTRLCRICSTTQCLIWHNVWAMISVKWSL